MLTIYHNPSCRKSREGLRYLQDSGTEFRIVEYLKERLTEKQLEVLLVKLNLKPSALLRTQEEFFKKHLRGKNFSDHELIRIMAENPKLIRRPVVEGIYKAVIGDPVSEIDLLLQ